jgi:hypothetical protein
VKTTRDRTNDVREDYWFGKLFSSNIEQPHYNNIHQPLPSVFAWTRIGEEEMSKVIGQWVTTRRLGNNYGNI